MLVLSRRLRRPRYAGEVGLVGGGGGGGGCGAAVQVVLHAVLVVIGLHVHDDLVDEGAVRRRHFSRGGNIGYEEIAEESGKGEFPFVLQPSTAPLFKAISILGFEISLQAVSRVRALCQLSLEMGRL